MTTGTGSRWRNRRQVAMLDPEVYQKDRVGFVRALRAIHEAARFGFDTSRSYLIVENDRVVGIGGCNSQASVAVVRRPVRSFR